MAFVSRFNSSGRSIANDIYHGVENGTIRLEATVIADGRRLDHYAYEYYGDGLNAWIIAAASGIRWTMGIGNGKGNLPPGEDNSIVLFIPNLDDVRALKG